MLLCLFVYFFRFILEAPLQQTAISFNFVIGMQVCLIRALVQVLDVASTISPDYRKLKEVSLFLTSPVALPDPNSALGLYISLGGQDWQFRGYVSADHPSEVRTFMLKVRQELQGSDSKKASILQAGG